MSIITLFFTVLGAGAACVAGYFAKKGISESRINSAVTSYVGLVERARDSGVSALLKSDVAGMSEKQLRVVLARIKAATGHDPFSENAEIGNALKTNAISISKFINYVTNRGLTPRNWDMKRIIEDLKPASPL